MNKHAYYLNNPSSESIRVVELNISLPPGISDLFVLNPDITFEQIDYSLRNGTLRAAMENGLCYLVPDISKSFSDDILIRKPFQVQILPSRARFTSVKNPETSVFDAEEDAGLFDEDDLRPARQIEEDMKKALDNVQSIEATVREANLPEKPIENRYTSPQPPVIRDPETQQKIRNDLIMGYETCNGKTADGKRCLRQAKTGKKFCGLHKSQA